MQLAKTLCLLLLGVMLGWWLHDVASIDGPQQISVVTPASLVVDQPARNYFAESSRAPEHDFFPVSKSAGLPNAAQFRQLLMGQQFEGALVYYENALSLDEAYLGLLKPVFEQYLTFCLEQCGDGVFVVAVNLWLAAYYQDIPVLLLLAEHQRLQGWPEAAASTLQLAATYAWQTQHWENINAAVQRLVLATDETLSRQENWVELLGFYEYLEVMDLGTREFILREAILYGVLGEAQRSRELLLELRESDNKLNPEWTAALEQQWSLSSPPPETEGSPGYAVALTRHGDHFVVEATVNRITGVKLLIDTGASLTTLSQASFNDLPKTRFKY